MIADIRELLCKTARRWKQRKLISFPSYIAELNNMYPGIPLNQQIYLIERFMDKPPSCVVCGGEVFFHSESRGYYNTCSRKCMFESWNRNGTNQNKIIKARKTNIGKYGVDNPMKNNIIRAKAESTNLKRYGSKTGKLLLVESVKSANIKKGSIEFRNKVIDTVRGKYGVDHISQLTETKDKVKKTLIDKFGVSAASQIHISPDTLELLNNQETFILFLSGKTIQEAAAHLGVHFATVCKYARQYGLLDGLRSNLERSMFKWLDELGLEFKTDRKILGGKEIDRLCVQKKFGIELNGLSSHSEILGKKDKHYHKWKTDECEKQGIRLLHIFEDEWINQQSIVKNIICSQLRLQKSEIGARLLGIDIIDKVTAKNFLKNHHIQGNGSLKVCIGAFNKDRLVGVMGFGFPSRQCSFKWELKRFCTDGKTYPGLGSRLFKYFVKEFNPTTIVSFCDKRYFIGNSYLSMGFHFDGLIPPDYFYVKDYHTRYHKSIFRLENIRKKFNINTAGKTEWECMQELGFDRIWDSGKKRFVWCK